jgi:fluoride ion exporter CrcB/FEX
MSMVPAPSTDQAAIMDPLASHQATRPTTTLGKAESHPTPEQLSRGWTDAVPLLAWQLLLPAAAECITSEFLPRPTALTSASGIDLTSSLANIIGAFLEGLRYGVGQQTGCAQTRQLCVLFRFYFLSAFTSFPFVAVHAAELAVVSSPTLGLLYIVVVLTTAVAAFEMGRWPTVGIAADDLASAEHWTRWMGLASARRRMLQVLAAVVVVGLVKSKVVTLLRLGGDSDFDADSRLGDTAVGVVFAIAGAVSGSYAKSSLHANLATCVLVAMAFSLERRTVTTWSQTSPLWETAINKFVGSFCGAASGFATMLTDWANLTREGHPRDAAVMLGASGLMAVFFAATFFAFDREGLDACSHSLTMFCS